MYDDTTERTQAQTQTADEYDDPFAPNYGRSDRRLRMERGRRKIIGAMKLLILTILANMAIEPLRGSLTEALSIDPIAADVVVGLVAICVWFYMTLAFIRIIHGSWLMSFEPIHVLAYPIVRRVTDRIDSLGGN